MAKIENESGGVLRSNEQEITRPTKKQDKIIRPSEIPGRDEASGFQAPKKPGYDVDDPGRGPGAIKEVGDMGDRMYAGLDDADMEADMSHDATNRIAGFGAQTASDPHDASQFQPPRMADKPRGENSPESVESRRMTGTESDSPFDRFPHKQR